MALRDLKIGTKQGIGFGVILVVMAGVSIFVIRQMGALRNEIDDINQLWLGRAVVSARLNINTSALRHIQLEYALATNQRRRQLYADSMNTLIDEIYEGGDAYDSLMTDVKSSALFSQEEQELTDELEALWDSYLILSVAFVDLRRQEALDFFSGEMRTVFDDLSTTLERLVKLNEDSAAEAARRAEATYIRTRSRLRISLIGTILLAALVAALLVRHITVPVRNLVNAARKVADGNFDVYVESPSKDEIGKMAQSFNWMTQSLKAQQEDLRTANAELQEQKNELEQTLHRLEDTQEQLVLKEKMASLGQLTAGIAHEIKNPLNFVNNFAQLSVELAEELSEELEANKAVPVAEVLGEVDELLGDLRFNAEKIHEHGRRADGIVHGMLEHSRGKAGERRTLAVNTFVEEYVNLAYHGMRARETNFNVTIERDYDEAAGEVSVVPQEMGRVLLNVFNNAFYAVFEKRQADGSGYAPMVQVSTRRQGRRIAIRVQDNGPGIPEAIRARIFEPFFTTKPTGSGNTGLGLSLSYEIVTQGHGGMLAVESEEGHGATFVVMLPG